MKNMSTDLQILYDDVEAHTALVDSEEKATAQELAPLVPDLPIRDLVGLWEEAAAAATLMGRIRDAIGECVHAQVALPVRVGGRWYSYSGYKRTKVIDRDALVAYLGDRWPEVIAIERVRKTALDKVAADKGDDPVTVRNTFLDEQWTGTRRLKAGPVSTAPDDTPDLEEWLLTARWPKLEDNDG